MNSIMIFIGEEFVEELLSQGFDSAHRAERCIQNGYTGSRVELVTRQMYFYKPVVCTDLASHAYNESGTFTVSCKVVVRA